MTEHPEARHTTWDSMKTTGVWLLGHASWFLPTVVLAAVILATWSALRQVHPRDVLTALHGMDVLWIALAGVLTSLNIAIMGLYDVVAFPMIRTPATERWRYGAVAFAWSNFLTLGPLAGPAIRFWLYRPTVAHHLDLEAGVLSIAIAFGSGLVGWTTAVALVPVQSPMGGIVMAVVAWMVGYASTYVARVIAAHSEQFDEIDSSPAASLMPSIVGWLDWLLASLVFLACLRATGVEVALTEAVRSFFFGQAIGVASLVPGGFGSSDAFWIAHLPLDPGVAAGALVTYRLVYYVVPWAAASLVLLSWATRRAARGVELARRLVAGTRGRRRRPHSAQHGLPRAPAPTC